MEKKSTPIGQEEKPSDKNLLEDRLTFFKDVKEFSKPFPLDDLKNLGFGRKSTGDYMWLLGDFHIPAQRIKKYKSTGHIDLVDLLVNLYEAGIREGKFRKSKEISLQLRSKNYIEEQDLISFGNKRKRRIKLGQNRILVHDE